MLAPEPRSDGLILRSEAALAGFTDSQFHRMNRRNELLRLARGVYVCAANYRLLDEIEQHAARVRAALSAQRTECVVSHQSAAVLHGLPLWGVDLRAVHLTKSHGSGRSTNALHVHAAPLADADLWWVRGQRVTSPPRTVFDLAASVLFEQAVVVADAALHAQLTSRLQLEDQLERGQMRHGRSRARAVVQFADGRSESVGESRSRVGMMRAGLPAPGLQCSVIRPDGTLAGRTDFDWAELRLLGEFDGIGKYLRWLKQGEGPADAVVREKIREDQLRELGYGMIRWIWAELERPARLYPRIQAALTRAARLVES